MTVRRYLPVFAIALLLIVSGILRKRTLSRSLAPPLRSPPALAGYGL